MASYGNADTSSGFCNSFIQISQGDSWIVYVQNVIPNFFLPISDAAAFLAGTIAGFFSSNPGILVEMNLFCIPNPIVGTHR